MANRDVPDGELLERVQGRVRRPRGPGLHGLRPRLSWRPRRISTAMATGMAVFAMTGGVALACVSTGCSPGQIITTVWNFCNPKPPQPTPVTNYCQPQGQQWTSYNTVVSYGDKECVCPPKQTSGGSNGWTSYDSQTSNYGSQKLCCPTGQSPSSGNQICCPTSQTGWMSPDNKTTGCCPTGQTGWMSSDNKTSACCPNGEKPTTGSNVCCPTNETGWISSDNTKIGCCPTGQVGWVGSDGKTTGCCPTGQTGWMSTDYKSSGCCPNGDSPSGTNNLCCPNQTNSYGTLSSGSGIQKGCCPPTQKISLRWHYSGNTSGSTWSSGSWSSTQSNSYGGSWSWGGSMEGALKVSPGSTLKVGYDLTIPGNSSLVDFTVNNPQVVFTVACVSGRPTASTFTATIPSQAFAFSGSSWYPSGTQGDSSVYQGSVTVPNLCHGGQLLLSSGGTFSTSVS